MAVLAHLVGVVIHDLVMPPGAQAVGRIIGGARIEWRVELAVGVVAGGTHHAATRQVGQERRVCGLPQVGADKNLPLVVALVEAVAGTGEGDGNPVGQQDVCACGEVIAEAAHEIGRVAAAGRRNGPVEESDACVPRSGDGKSVGLRISTGVRAARQHCACGGSGGTAQVNDPSRRT